MNLVCYGASVTAQKNESGFFHHLSSSELQNVFNKINRVSFGASQYEYAGYAFMADVLKKKPDVCLIDWLTPGMREFSTYKITLLNRALLQANCLPIWVFFPRTNNFNNLPSTYFQVKKDCESFGIPFINLIDYMPDFSDNPSKYLRDTVHTNETGASVYANVLHKTLMNLDYPKAIDQAKSKTAFSNSIDDGHLVPTITDVVTTLDNSNKVEITTCWTGGRLEIYLDTTVGPHVCFLNFKVYQNNELIWEEVFNPADPWSYYERAMVVETLRKSFPPGSYKIIISKSAGYPFTDLETKKPLEIEYDEQSRYLDIKRISVNANTTITAHK